MSFYLYKVNENEDFNDYLLKDVLPILTGGYLFVGDVGTTPTDETQEDHEFNLLKQLSSANKNTKNQVMFSNIRLAGSVLDVNLVLINKKQLKPIGIRDYSLLKLQAAQAAAAVEVGSG